MAFDTELMKGHTTLLILSALAERPMHGYGIAARLEERSNGVFHLREGSLYPALHKLEQRRWLQASWEGPSGGRRRRVYRLTARGRRQLAKMKQQWEKVAGAVRLVIGATA